MDENFPDRETLVARVRQLELERDHLYRDIEQLCMQQAGPVYLGVASRMHLQRIAGLEQEVENLKNKLAACTRENQNLQEELSEAYRIKSQLANLHSAEVSKNAEAEKQLKFFQGYVAAAFAERDNAIMEAEKAKEREELMPQELKKSQKRVKELTAELLEEEEQVSSFRMDLEKYETQNEILKEVIDKFYDIRQCYLEDSTDASWEEKCECLMSDSEELWRFQNEQDTSTSNYINSLEAEIESLRKGMDSLQNKLRVGLEIETHLKKKVRDLEKKRIIPEEKIMKQMSELLHYHFQCRIDITNLLDEVYSEINLINDQIIEKIRQVEQSRECDLQPSSLVLEKELQENECRDVHVSSDSGPVSITKSDDPSLPTHHAPETVDASEALALALQEKVSALLLLSQQEERHLLERNVNAALQKKIEELQRNLLQVTNEKVKALINLAQLKQECHMLQENINQNQVDGKHMGETGAQRTVQEKDGRIRSLFKRTYLTRWTGGSGGNDADAHEKLNHTDYARMKIENATLKESLESMEHLISSARRLRISLSKVKDSAAQKSDDNVMNVALDQIITEANLVKTALGSSLPVTWSGKTDELPSSTSSEIYDARLHEKVDVVSEAGLEMVELLVFAAHVLEDLISKNSSSKGDGIEMNVSEDV